MTTPVVVELRADGRGVVATFDSVGRAAKGTEQQFDRTSRSTQRLSRRTASATDRFRKFRAVAVTAIAALGVRQIARAADEMTLLNARLNLVTDSQEEFTRAQRATFDIANRNGAAVGAVGELYVRLAQSLGDAGAEAEELETITQAVTQSMRVSGSSAAESSGAILQLSQAFAAGVLRGDEFNSVNEQAPRLMQALAVSLGVTRGELRGLAEQGELTSEILREALVEQSGTIAAEAAQIPITIGQAFERIQNSILRTISVLNEATGAAAAVSDAISGAAENVALLAGAFADARAEVQALNPEMDSLDTNSEDVAENLENAARAALRFGAGLVAVVKFAQTAASAVKTLATEAGAFQNLQGNIDQFKEGNFLDALFGPGSSDFFAGDGFNNKIRTDGVFSALGELLRRGTGLAKQTEETAQRTDSALQDIGEAFSTTFDEVLNAFSAADRTADLFRERIRKSADETEDFNDQLKQTPDAAGSALEAITVLSDAAQEFEERLFSLRREMAGPLQNAQVEFQREAGEMFQLFATGQITFEQFGQGIDLITQRFELARDEIGNRMAQTLEDLAFKHLPPVIQQMLGLADAAGQVSDRTSNVGRFSRGISASLFNGQDLGDSIGSSLLAFGQEPITEAVSEAFGNAFKNLPDSQQFQDGLSVAALAIGQAAEGNVAGAVGAVVGGIIGSIIPGIGTLVGSAIGSALGSLAGGAFEDDPRFELFSLPGGSNLKLDRSDTFNTAFGEQAIRFRDFGAQAESEFIKQFQQIDLAFANVIRRGSFSEVAEALQDFEFDSRDAGKRIEDIFAERGEAIIDALFDSSIAAIVKNAGSIEEQLQRVADVFAIENALIRGIGLGLTGDLSAPVAPPAEPLPGFGGGGGGGGEAGPPGQRLRPNASELAAFNAVVAGTGDAAAVSNPELLRTLTLMEELARPGESLAEVFAKNVAVAGAFDRALALTGNAFEGTREDMIRFGADLVSIFGEDAEFFAARLDRTLGAIFSDDELATQAAARARQQISDLLGSIGVEVTEAAFTASGFREIFESLFGAVGPEETAALIEAGNAFADLIEAQEQLAGSTDDLADTTKRLADQQAFLRDVGRQALEVIAPTRVAFARLTDRLAENDRVAQDLLDTEQQFSVVRLSSQIQLQGFIAALSESIPQLNDQLFGTADAANEAGNAIADGVRNTRDAWLGAIDQIRDALDQQLIGPNSSLTNRERLNEAESQLADLVDAANAGDLNAAQQVAQLFRETIAQGAGFFGTSTDDFAAFEERIRELAGSVPANATIPPAVSTAQNTAATAASARELELSAFEQIQLATQLLDQVGLMTDLQQQMGRDISATELARSFGVPIGELIRVLTGEVPDLTGDALATFFDELVSQANQQFNELASLEAINVDQLTGIRELVSIGQQMLAELGKVPDQFAGPAPDMPAFINGGPVRSTGPALVHEGEFVIPRNGALVSSDPALIAEVRALRAEVRTGNTDRRTGVELEVEEIAAVRALLAERGRRERQQSMRPVPRTRDLTRR